MSNQDRSLPDGCDIAGSYRQMLDSAGLLVDAVRRGELPEAEGCITLDGMRAGIDVRLRIVADSGG